MKVFKFGGASISTIERIQNVAAIMQSFPKQKILIIISAMGKTTNALEKVAEAFYAGKKEEALQLFHQVKENHLNTLKYLISVNWQQAENQLKDFFTEVEWLLHDKPVREYDYYYDQIVCCGELLSTAIVSNYLNETGIKNTWLDVRDIFRTDDNFRDAAIDWNFTQQKVTEDILPLFETNDIIITQGFIGATDENESTTLGREGSDYSAAVFANLLDAEDQTIWKDVEGVMNADPKQFADAKFIEQLSYAEVIEMAFYGAQVIHPKTIKPLQNKSIPLHVRCFLKPILPGTIISNKPVHNLPPIIVVKENQALIQFTSKDFSFVEGKPIDFLHGLFDEIKIQPNLTQNTAITIFCCLDDRTDKIEKLAIAAGELFDVQIQKGLTLLTVRHYNKEIVEELTANKIELLSQKTKDTMQILVASPAQ
ncbi:aspartate kinase [Ferruginibacter albus]|uniref:aspartate kinase n=1 Tax=Ferruginibacter albus TaxID=2875540 RepID=UPI001CC817FA|nr:aspartate kinase [Ferruginibacter albus]UAY51377.1 aspartate kinase [Ferruginibacter albus]